jgi:hypothetical protein
LSPTSILAAVAAIAAAVGSPAETASAGRPPIALSVSPARVALAAPASTTIQLRNLGSTRVVIDATPRSVGRRVSPRWLSIRPREFALRAGSRAVLTLRADVRRRIRPGDHEVVVLFVTHPLERRRVAVRIRLGIRVRVRMPGRMVRRVDVGGVRVLRRRSVRALLVSVANRGNVTEQLRGRVTVTLLRHSRAVASLQPQGPSQLPAGARTVLAARYAGAVRGGVTVVVRLRLGGSVGTVERRYRLRL